eukprot:CAMPEP_0179281564 /NCGR_PEP_ID=MMETSP0797-20121207/37219_1 /TAXON_ID=47934 /ORGANISM="Dinophysis acuminata, Strain DAEP01" /LENGTH=192 /DNA_ID=CAMNT_0020990277 /DNA_START=61 /DNA_END=635 /DNA_ORIENTATION=-
MAKKKAKFIGSCGIYVFVANKSIHSWPLLLVHRRSKHVSEPNTICPPGGIVERLSCGSDGLDFGFGARQTAVKELREETGVELDRAAVELLGTLPVGAGTYWGPEWHRNYFTVLDDFPAVVGPEKDSLHEVVPGGMDGIGTPAGDGYHAWVAVDELLSRSDLMPGCRVPVQHFVAPESGGAGARQAGLAAPG